MKVNTIEEYIKLFKEGKSLSDLELERTQYTELYNYVYLHKNEDNDFLLIYAFCLLKGYGIEKNEKKAVKLFKKLSKKENVNAQCNLGFCYYKGYGVEQSYEEAVYWYRKAAEQGYARAQCSLGICYYEGYGVEQSYKSAVYWYRKAAEQGYARAQCSLGICYSLGKGVEQFYESAVYWYRKAAEQGNADAQYQLASCYKNGEGVEQTYEEAVNWYKKAAEQGGTRAQYNLGICYSLGKGVEQSYESAVYWYRKAAKQGDVDAQEALEQITKTLEEIEFEKEHLHHNNRKDVFISWNHNDKKVKDEIAKKLEEKDILTIWESDGDGEGDLKECIQKAINEAHSFIILLTGNSVQSTWVKQEVELILSKSQESQKKYLINPEDKDFAYKQCIRILLLNRITKDNKEEFFDVESYIKSLDDDNPFHKLLDFSWIFPVNDNIDYDSLESSILKAIEWAYILEYKKNIKKKYEVFPTALTKVVENHNVGSRIIPTALEFEKSYLDRNVFDEGNSSKTIAELLNQSNPILI